MENLNWLNQLKKGHFSTKIPFHHCLFLHLEESLKKYLESGGACDLLMYVNIASSLTVKLSEVDEGLIVLSLCGKRKVKMKLYPAVSASFATPWTV